MSVIELVTLDDQRMEQAKLEKKSRQTTNHWEATLDSLPIACSYELIHIFGGSSHRCSEITQIVNGARR